MAEFFHSVFWICLAKVVLVVWMFASGAACLIVFRNSKEWERQLALVETECDSARDNAMLQARDTRQQLHEFRVRLSKRPEKAEMEVIGDLMKQAMPVMTLLFKKETSLIKWGFAGAKLAKSAFEFFSSRQRK